MMQLVFCGKQKSNTFVIFFLKILATGRNRSEAMFFPAAISTTWSFEMMLQTVL